MGTDWPEPVFFTINPYASVKHEERLSRHDNCWLNGFKALLVAKEGEWIPLLADIPRRPFRQDARRPSASVAADELVGLLAKYNLQYRRPAPIKLPMLDNWTLSPANNIPVDVVKLFTTEPYHVDVNELRHTHTCVAAGQCRLGSLARKA